MKKRKIAVMAAILCMMVYTLPMNALPADIETENPAQAEDKLSEAELTQDKPEPDPTDDPDPDPTDDPDADPTDDPDADPTDDPDPDPTDDPDADPTDDPDPHPTDDPDPDPTDDPDADPTDDPEETQDDSDPVPLAMAFNGYNAFEFRMTSGLLGDGTTFWGSLLAVRESGAGLREWQVCASYNSGETHTISGLLDDVAYEYVFKYCRSGYEHSTKGTLQYNSASDDWAYTCPLRSAYFLFTQESHPLQGSTLVLTATSPTEAPSNTNGATRQGIGTGSQFRTNAGAAPLQYLEMYGGDETPLCSSTVYVGGYIYYYVPVSTPSIYCDYVLEAPGYMPATGKYYSNSTSGVGTMLPDDPATHEITYSGSSYVMINLWAAEISVSLTGLYNGTTLVPVGANSGMCGINSYNDKITFDLGGAASADVQVNVVHPGFATVPLKFRIDGTTVTLLNEADIQSLYTAKTITDAKQFSFTSSSGRMVLPQLPLYTLTYVPERGLYRATTTDLGAYVAHNMTYDPGRPAWCDFEIHNDTGKNLKLVEYSFSATNEHIFNDLLRLNSPALQGYFAAKGISTGPDKRYIFDFETLAGESFYDAMLWYFREECGYSGITDLKQVPAEIIASELFYDSGGYRFDGTTWGGDPAAPYAIFVDTNLYSIREMDPDIWEVAEWLLYNYALSITFDSTDTPVITAGELSTLTGAQLATLYPAYRDKTSDNIAMMTRMLSGMQVMGNGDSMRFDNTAFALNGSYIHNAYRGTNYEFDFTFDLFFAEVGVSGIAFLDKNVNGILDHPAEDDDASRFSDLMVEMYRNGVSTERTTATNAYGYYHFDDVAEAAGYEVRIQIPVGYVVTPTMVDSFDGNRFQSNAQTDAFTVTLDREAYWFNAGFVAASDPDNPDPTPAPDPMPTPDPRPKPRPRPSLDPKPSPDLPAFDPRPTPATDPTPAADTDPTPAPDPEESAPSPTVPLPQTGDNGNIMDWPMLLAIGLAELSGAIVYRRWKRCAHTGRNK